MTRVSTHSQQQSLVNHLIRNQEQLNQYQGQVSTGKKATNFQGVAREANALLSSKAMESRYESYLTANRELQARLDLQNVALGSIADIADGLRQDIINAVNLNSSLGFEAKLTDSLDRLIGLLNTRHNGSYVFGGTRSDQEPVNVDNVTQLLALANTSDGFDNNTVKQSQRIDDERDLSFGQLASEVAQPLLDALRRILQFHNGTIPTGAGAFAPAGAFSDPLTTNQRDFLTSELSNAVSAINTARDYEARNGVNMASLNTVVTRQENDLTFIRTFIGNIENVDVAQAVVNLKETETALTASMQVIARLGNVSLINFI